MIKHSKEIQLLISEITLLLEIEIIKFLLDQDIEENLNYEINSFFDDDDSNKFSEKGENKLKELIIDRNNKQQTTLTEQEIEQEIELTRQFIIELYNSYNKFLALNTHSNTAYTYLCLSNIRINASKKIQQVSRSMYEKHPWNIVDNLLSIPKKHEIFDKMNICSNYLAILEDIHANTCVQRLEILYKYVISKKFQDLNKFNDLFYNLLNLLEKEMKNKEDDEEKDKLKKDKLIKNIINEYIKIENFRKTEEKNKNNENLEEQLSNELNKLTVDTLRDILQVLNNPEDKKYENTLYLIQKNSIEYLPKFYISEKFQENPQQGLEDRKKELLKVRLKQIQLILNNENKSVDNKELEIKKILESIFLVDNNNDIINKELEIKKILESIFLVDNNDINQTNININIAFIWLKFFTRDTKNIDRKNLQQDVFFKVITMLLTNEAGKINAEITKTFKKNIIDSYDNRNKQDKKNAQLIFVVALIALIDGIISIVIEALFNFSHIIKIFTKMPTLSSFNHDSIYIFLSGAISVLLSTIALIYIKSYKNNSEECIKTNFISSNRYSRRFFKDRTEDAVTSFNKCLDKTIYKKIQEKDTSKKKLCIII